MFVSHEKNVVKKTFQKPNILRKKPKVSVPKSEKSIITPIKESPGTKSLVSNTQNVVKAYLSSQKCEIGTHQEVSNKPIITKSIQKLTVVNNNVVNTSQKTDIDANINSFATISNNIIQINSAEKSIESSSLNIESFINGGAQELNAALSKTGIIASTEKKTNQSKTKWCLDASNNVVDTMLDIDGVPQSPEEMQNSDFIIDVVVPSVVTTTVVPQTSVQSQDIIYTGPKHTSIKSVDLFSNKAVKYKCDVPNCNKGFWSEERLNKHKSSHYRQTTVRPPSHITIECPVKKVISEGVEEKCPRTFQVRRDLLEHLNTDHSPEDAIYKCEVCGRRFFWASGLRAHAQSVCARGGLKCAWPGCGRVFRLPCRLREHARAHTGDRPYTCRYPECGWAFRSASKLVRHARRHTGERRHACGACGRAFLRREHLRDHAARHHPPHARATHRCTHQGCEQSFTHMSTLYMHMKRVHRQQGNKIVTPTVIEQTSAEEGSGDNVFVVSVVESGGASGGGVGGGARGRGGAEWQAARTHCTWPLRRSLHHAYILEDDITTENAEGSTQNVCVRSDLFLHGNAPIDDDSQNIGVSAISADGVASPALDADLCLIDSHPTIDLMQEELMYEDVAVDESSFRVLFS